MPMTHGCTEHLTFEGNQKVTLTGNCLSTLVRLFLFKYRTIKHLEISSFFELESSESTVCELLVLLLRGMNHIVLAGWCRNPVYSDNSLTVSAQNISCTNQSA